MRIESPTRRDFARGAAFLGTGGGGDPYIGRLMLEQALRARRRRTVHRRRRARRRRARRAARRHGRADGHRRKDLGFAEGERALRALERASAARPLRS